MEVLEERAAGQRLLHSKDWPGLYVWGEAGEALALRLRQEVWRWQDCFPTLRLQPATICSVTEKTQTAAAAAPGASTALFLADLDQSPRQLEQGLRLLAECVRRLWQCYRSFPDPAYDYSQGEQVPDWQPVSGDTALAAFVGPLARCLQGYQVTPASTQAPEALCDALPLLLRQPAFVQNRLQYTENGFVCAGSVVRRLLEHSQLCGRRMYRLGIAAFGRRAICDPFCFEAELPRPAPPYQ